MEIDEKSLRRLLEQGRVTKPELRVMDSGMNVSLSVDVGEDRRAILHTRRGGVRTMSPPAALRFVRDVLGFEELKVDLRNARQ